MILYAASVTKSAVKRSRLSQCFDPREVIRIINSSLNLSASSKGSRQSSVVRSFVRSFTRQCLVGDGAAFAFSRFRAGIIFRRVYVPALSRAVGRSVGRLVPLPGLRTVDYAVVLDFTCIPSSDERQDTDCSLSLYRLFHLEYLEIARYLFQILIFKSTQLYKYFCIGIFFIPSINLVHDGL